MGIKYKCVYKEMYSSKFPLEKGINGENGFGKGASRGELRMVLTALLFLLFAGGLKAQQWGVGTNALYWFTATPNVGLEYSFRKDMSVALNVNYNPFTFKNNRKAKHFLVQPEYRYWFSEAYKGHYVGVHATAGMYNFGNLPFGSLKDYRYEGNLYGAGITYGHQWVITNRLNLGVDVGLGYLRMDYDKFYCESCGDRIDHYKSNYFGPTKVGVSIIYLLK